MNLPFTVDEFFNVFGYYNEAIWPMQIVLLGLGVVVVALLMVRTRWSAMAISGVLAFLWAWLGIVYQVLFFARLDYVGYGFGALSLAGAGAFFWFGVVRRQLAYGAVELWRAVSGSALIAFAVAIYPIWSYQAGHPYPYLPTFGVPCSTTLFTLGVLAFLETPYPRSIFVAPVLWCVAGSEMAIELPVPQDLSLVVAGIAGMALFICSHGVDPEF